VGAVVPVKAAAIATGRPAAAFLISGLCGIVISDRVALSLGVCIKYRHGQEYRIPCRGIRPCPPCRKKKTLIRSQLGSFFALSVRSCRRSQGRVKAWSNTVISSCQKIWVALVEMEVPLLEARLIVDVPRQPGGIVVRGP